MTWFFNDQEIEASERYMITFDGTYATLFIASCVMEDMGEYKVVFENSAGTDETTGKVTVKPVSKKISREKYFLMIKLFSLPNRNLGKTFSNIFVHSQGTHNIELACHTNEYDWHPNFFMDEFFTIDIFLIRQVHFSK